jgi:tetratricopeptide (TPR) repeat protein
MDPTATILISVVLILVLATLLAIWVRSPGAPRGVPPERERDAGTPPVSSSADQPAERWPVVPAPGDELPAAPAGARLPRAGPGAARPETPPAVAAPAGALRELALHRQALNLARTSGDSEGEALALVRLAAASVAAGEIDEGIGLYREAVDIAHQRGDHHAQLAALRALGQAYVGAGLPGQAVLVCEEALEIARRSADRKGEAVLLGDLGAACRAQGLTLRAIACYELQLAVAREVADEASVVSALGEMGDAYASVGQGRRALDLYGEALALVRVRSDRRRSDQRDEGVLLWRTSLALDQLGQRAEAIARARAALALLEPLSAADAAPVRERLARWQGGA